MTRCHDCPSTQLYARGRCKRCYERAHRRTYQRPTYPHCTARGCTGTVVARGMCNKHWLRWRCHGHTSTCLTDAAPTRALLTLLRETGWADSRIGRRIGLARGNVHAIRTGQRATVRHTTAAAVQQLARQAAQEREAA